MKKSTHGEPLQFCKYTKGSFPVTFLNMLICKIIPMLYYMFAHFVSINSMYQISWTSPKMVTFFQTAAGLPFLMIQFVEDHFTLLCVLIYIKHARNTQNT